MLLSSVLHLVLLLVPLANYLMTWNYKVRCRQIARPTQWESLVIRGQLGSSNNTRFPCHSTINAKPATNIRRNSYQKQTETETKFTTFYYSLSIFLILDIFNINFKNSTENMSILTTDISYRLRIEKKITEFTVSQWATGQSPNDIKHFSSLQNCIFKTGHVKVSQ